MHFIFDIDLLFSAIIGSFKVDNYLPLISVLISHLSAKSAISRFNK